MKITPEMAKALTAHPLPNFHEMWRKYATSQFRRDFLNEWAADDPEKQRAVQDLLNETPPQ